jgi:hypothetical protein
MGSRSQKGHCQAPEGLSAMIGKVVLGILMAGGAFFLIYFSIAKRRFDRRR